MIKKRRTYYETTDDENSGSYIDRVNGSFNLYFGTNVNHTAIYTSTNLIYQSGNLFFNHGYWNETWNDQLSCIFIDRSCRTSKLAGPTGGYLVGFIFLALISGFFTEKFSNNVIMTAIGMILGTAVTYTFGTIWLCAQMHLTFIQGLYAAVIPYLPGDAAKIIVAIIVGSAVKKAVVKARVLPE